MLDGVAKFWREIPHRAFNSLMQDLGQFQNHPPFLSLVSAELTFDSEVSAVGAFDIFDVGTSAVPWSFCPRSVSVLSLVSSLPSANLFFNTLVVSILPSGRVRLWTVVSVDMIESRDSCLSES
jgi:hypothetical protein